MFCKRFVLHFSLVIIEIDSDAEYSICGRRANTQCWAVIKYRKRIDNTKLINVFELTGCTLNWESAHTQYTRGLTKTAKNKSSKQTNTQTLQFLNYDAFRYFNWFLMCACDCNKTWCFDGITENKSGCLSNNRAGILSAQDLNGFTNLLVWFSHYCLLLLLLLLIACCCV